MDKVSTYKKRFIIAEVSFIIVIGIVLLKCSGDYEYFKILLGICFASLVGGTVINGVATLLLIRFSKKK